jgi:hypothetical protein
METACPPLASLKAVMAEQGGACPDDRLWRF